MGAKGHQLQRHIDETLRVGNVKEAVRLPPGEDLSEWLAVNTVQFFLAASTLYSMLEDFCDETVCPIMSAGPKFEYLWADGVKIKKPIKVRFWWWVILSYSLLYCCYLTRLTS